MQLKLLRGIQEKAIRPIGIQQELPVDVRILSATHKDLAAEVETGKFRQDLYYRINVIELKVPNLRDRIGDIPLLADELLQRIASDYKAKPPSIDKEAMRTLEGYKFPGNVRELENILERAFTLCDDNVIHVDDLSLNPAKVSAMSYESAPELANEIDVDTASEIHEEENETIGVNTLPEDSDSLESYLEGIEKNVIVDALESTRWNKTAAAKKLGITFRALRYRLKKLGLE
jgi:two-component system response regulator PilR (NtrC family)